ncbi:leucine-rich repeat-containing protein 15 isoform X3 [Patella vulgata]|nr:leucine-rich repeat-containing protein 15 isoform X3 [Patella vulgata]
MILYHIIGVLLLASVWCQACPSGCTCRDATADCYGKLPRMSQFQQQTIDISIHDVETDEIPENTFADLKNRNRINLYNMKIRKIKYGAFKNIENIKGINLYSSTIGTIETNAFTDIRNLSVLSIYSTNITTIEPYAFNRIRDLGRFAIYDVKIDSIKTQAFANFYRLNLFTIYSSSLDLIQNNTFYKFLNIKKITFYDNTVGELQCNSLDILKKLNGSDVNYYSNRLTCDCKLSWFVHAVIENPRRYGNDDGNVCNAPQKYKNRGLVSVALEISSCPGQKQACPSVTDLEGKRDTDNSANVGDNGGSSADSLFNLQPFLITSLLVITFL